MAGSFSSKILLVIIALGIWVNAFIEWRRPLPPDPNYTLGQIQRDTEEISSDLHDLTQAVCHNSKLC
jgi:hypothetical protein